MKKSIDNVLGELEGLNTIETIQKKLKLKRNTVIKVVHELRKLGYVGTSGGGKQPRLYRISRTKIKKIGNPGMYDIINKNSPIKLTRPYEHRIINRRLSIEEVIIRAIKTRNFRIILASLALFNKVRNWSELYQHAKKENVRKELGALYDVARKIIRVKKMHKKTRDVLLKAKEKNRYIIKGLKSNDFEDIEKRWKIRVPFNESDLERYKE